MSNFSFKNKKFPIKAIPTVTLAILVSFFATAFSISFLKDNKDFLLGCLLGIVHGHRNQHLSMRTGYIIPYIPKPKPEIVYKNSIEIITKVKILF